MSRKRRGTSRSYVLTLAHSSSRQAWAPARRIGGVSVVSERDGALDEAAIEAAARRLGVATGVELSGDTGAFRVLTISNDEPPQRRQGAGFDDLVALVLDGE